MFSQRTEEVSAAQYFQVREVAPGRTVAHTWVGWWVEKRVKWFLTYGPLTVGTFPRLVNIFHDCCGDVI